MLGTMKYGKPAHFSVAFLLVGVLAQALANGAPHEPVSDEEEDAVDVLEPMPYSEISLQQQRSASFPGLDEVTVENLYREGVDISGANRTFTQAELKRLSSLPDPADTGIKSIIGYDTRERLYTTYFPARARALITFSGGRCSGNLIGHNTLVTAGHCVHTGGHRGNWRLKSSFKIYPGANGTSIPYGSCNAKSLHSVKGWTEDVNEMYDYGAIKLSCTVGDTVGDTVGWYGWTTEDPMGRPAIVGGYPGDRPLEQWQSSDKVRAVSAQQIFYLNDTIGGMSGSGVWYDSDGPVLIGIHAYGIGGSGYHAIYNHGKRITNAVHNNLTKWKNLP